MIVCRSPAEIEKMRRANQLVVRILDELRALVVPGATTQEIDWRAEQLTRDAGAEPAFKGYRGFPYTICASLNEQVVHGFPSDRALVQGDILSIDMGVRLDGYYGDCAVTLAVGRIAPETARLLQITREALDYGIAQVQIGRRVSDIGHAVQAHVEAHGYSVVREFVGHGVGTRLHEEPQVPNYGLPGRGPRLAAGMVLAIEPMVNMGKAAVRVLRDGWTAVTVDGSLSAHFEHSVAVAATGPDILTLLPETNGTRPHVEHGTALDAISAVDPRL
ncbi:MAG: type I methionyl aminopeptidase [Luteitalea sp.]|nr:type I methionyl aminopeptidase [Luteitalea sp.]